jgi:hypothetical protein
MFDIGYGEHRNILFLFVADGKGVLETECGESLSVGAGEASLFHLRLGKEIRAV